MDDLERVDELIKQGDWDAALKVIDQCCSRDPGNAKLWTDRAFVLLRLRRFDDAFDSLERCLALDPRNLTALMNKGLALLNLGRPEEALATFERARTARPDHPRPWIEIARLKSGLIPGTPEKERYTGRELEALDHLKEALRIDPDLADAWYVRAYVLYRLSHYVSAAMGNLPLPPAEELARDSLAAYARAIKLRPDDTDFWWGKALALESWGKIRQALAALSKATKLRPDAPEFWYRKALLHAKDDPAAALRCLARAIDLNPHVRWHAKQDFDSLAKNRKFRRLVDD